MIPFGALKDGSVDLLDVALMNDYLALCADNEMIMREREDD